VQYWQHAPAVLDWNPDTDHSPCPLASTYQLVRNVLAATVRQDRVETASGHALIIYDERNPAFWPGGDARSAYDAACTALRHPGLLRTVSWQRIIDQLSAAGDLRWLVEGLEAKYGLTNSATVLRRLRVVLQVASSPDLPSPGTGTTARGTVSHHRCHHRLPHADRIRPLIWSTQLDAPSASAPFPEVPGSEGEQSLATGHGAKRSLPLVSALVLDTCEDADCAFAHSAQL